MVTEGLSNEIMKPTSTNNVPTTAPAYINGKIRNKFLKSYSKQNRIFLIEK